VIKILHVVDEFTRESLADLVVHSIDADATVACLDKVAGVRGRHPAFIRCDIGPELTANAVRDWCRFGGAGASYIDPGSPWQNPWVESYGSRMRDELLTIEQFDTLLEAQVLVPTGGPGTTPTVPTPPWGCSPPPSSLGTGGPTHPSSHSKWTDERGPVTPTDPQPMRSVRWSRLTERRLTLTRLRGTPSPRKRDKVRRQPPSRTAP
jgi:Integrase core domain